jgi:Fe-S cluster assembly ATP-binding protein
MNYKKKLLEIKNLEVEVDKKKILKNLNLIINENEIHLIMGPNGSGKSTLSKVLAGHPAYLIKNGSIFLKNKDLLCLKPEIRAHEGIFLAFQYPVEINGVTNYDFLRIAYNEKLKYFNQEEKTPLEFFEILNSLKEKLKIDDEFLNRNVNQGFSGGEKKKNEILQMLLLKPELIILDELDSGLDIDALKLIFSTILKIKEKTSSLVIITHNPKILDYIETTNIHIMINGKIIKTGNLDLIKEIEKYGYEKFIETL